MMRRLALLLFALLAAIPAIGHHGWSEYDADRPMTLNGRITESGYEHPHGFIRLKTDEKTWTVVLAPPTRMENRGLAKGLLKAGNQASVHGYPKRDDPQELRAERITINQKTVELR